MHIWGSLNQIKAGLEYEVVVYDLITFSNFEVHLKIYLNKNIEIQQIIQVNK